MERQSPKKKHTALQLLVLLALLVVALILALVVAKKLEMRTYKLNYPELISKYSSEYAIDPYLVAAVIHCESSNRETVVSRSGAIGLMQVMPETGEWIAGKLKIESFDPEALKDPGTNIRFGCWYLCFLLERYDGNIPNAVAAYNAGHGNVDKWLLDASISNEGTLENIPFPETDQYVEKVQRAHEKYETLYPDAFKKA
ncbi:lytic transglycosylase domain-containing protein [Christensenellaceae bacterium OttesenSCG-928-M15]|nr:lytic transglycosylase domain-containing protein [Christensenellaceae bacterium OttesenSCG-928-M15]